MNKYQKYGLAMLGVTLLLFFGYQPLQKGIAWYVCRDFGVEDRDICERQVFSSGKESKVRSPLLKTISRETYRSEKYGFEIQYPSNFILNQNKTDEDDDRIIRLIRSTNRYIDHMVTAGVKLLIEENCVFQSQEVQDNQSLALLDSEKNINGITFSYYNNHNPKYLKAYFNAYSGNNYVDVYRTSLGGVCYEVKLERNEATYGADEGKIPGVFDEILSTFTFKPGLKESLEAERARELDFSQWKTYREKENGFEFSYPPNWWVESKYSDLLQGLIISMHDPLHPYDRIVISPAGLYESGDIDTSRCYRVEILIGEYRAGRKRCPQDEKGDFTFDNIYFGEPKSPLYIGLFHRTDERITKITDLFLSSFKFVD